MKKNSIAKLWRSTNPPKGILLIGIILTLIGTSINLIIPLILKDFMENLSEGISFFTITSVVILFILEIITSAAALYILALVGQRVVLNLRKKLWNKLLDLEVNYYHKNNSGEILSRVTNDTSVVANLLSSDIAELISGAIAVIGTVFILFILDIPMTLILLAVIPVTIFIILPISKKMYDVSFEHQEKMSQLTGLLSKVLGEIKLVKSYNAKEIEMENGDQQINLLFKNSMRKSKLEAIFSPLLGGTITLIIMGIVGFGAFRVSEGHISSGELLAFVLYLFQIVGPISIVSRFIANMQSAVGSTERIFKIMDEKTEENLGALSPNIGELKFEGVSFKYTEENILNDISFKIIPNSINAIVGPSGAGKTTLFYLLERFYKPTSGEILLNGVSHSDIDLEKWREMFSYVSQDCPILAGTIKENIVYGSKKEASEQDIINVAKLANCHEFISNLPDGYNTILSERGINLSGGQKQRIAIARALFRDAPFLLLDEAIASLDSASESKIQQAINNLIQGRTTIVIAHRISTIKNAEQIIVLNNGCIVGVGNHQTLIEESPLYRLSANQNIAS